MICGIESQKLPLLVLGLQAKVACMLFGYRPLILMLIRVLLHKLIGDLSHIINAGYKCQKWQAPSIVIMVARDRVEQHIFLKFLTSFLPQQIQRLSYMFSVLIRCTRIVHIPQM